MQPKIVKTLQEITDYLGGRLVGDPQEVINGIASLAKAKKGQLSFLTNPQYKSDLNKTQASVVLIQESDLNDCPVNAIITDNPYMSLAKVACLFQATKPNAYIIHPTVIMGLDCVVSEKVSIGAHCVIGNNVKIGENVVIGAGCIIGDDVSIANNTTLKPNVTFYSNVQCGEACLIHSGAVIGSDGFGFANHQGEWIKIPQLGGVIIQDKVEIGSNTTIDRGAFENTIISKNVIIDNLVQIGHNVIIGDYTAIAGCVAIAGSTKIGKYCLIGGGASIAGHLEIADKVIITGMSGVNHSLKKTGSYSSGMPAKPSQIWRKNVARFHRLDEMFKTLRLLKNHINDKSP
ncbi:MAG: UDP-3-O-(3-hydroxymyristoyl)glucosamine N-acyltransferase [Francisellaceae bacterium]|nr:UDP-3-O-(3-hydroxymyristoyl)glucosamine N-acyltransferase [Francisellaceae bacterium]